MAVWNSGLGDSASCCPAAVVDDARTLRSTSAHLSRPMRAMWLRPSRNLRPMPGMRAGELFPFGVTSGWWAGGRKTCAEAPVIHECRFGFSMFRPSAAAAAFNSSSLLRSTISSLGKLRCTRHLPAGRQRVPIHFLFGSVSTEQKNRRTKWASITDAREPTHPPANRRASRSV